MNESRVDYLVSLFVDDRLSEEKSGELATLIEDQPELLEELQAQLEAADLVSQAENDHRSPSRFLEEFQLRLDEPIMPNPNEDDHKPLLRRQPTGLWKSHFPDDIEHGEWQPTAFRDVAEQGVNT
jgi:hypothetical protein